MRETVVNYFTDKEESIISILVALGMRSNSAKVLVFLSSTEITTSRQIERGTDLRQPDVSLAIKDLTARGWVRAMQDSPSRKGRPRKIYSLSMSVPEIIGTITTERVS